LTPDKFGLVIARLAQSEGSVALFPPDHPEEPDDDAID
jgi:hypothetical protein